MTGQEIGGGGGRKDKKKEKKGKENKQEAKAEKKDKVAEKKADKDDASREIKKITRYHMRFIARRPVFRVFNQVRHKPGCVATGARQKPEILYG